jgi:putative hydrolase of the HAD superfamily
MKSVELVVFDLDDTLYLERDYVRSGFKAVDAWLYKARGIEGFFEAAWCAFEQGKRGTIFNEALKQLRVGSNAQLIESMVEVYRAHVPEIFLAGDAENCLQRLRGLKRMALISDGALKSQQAKVSALRLNDFIEYLVLTDALGKEYRKPSKKPFEAVQNHFQVSCDHCVYVADNPQKDFMGPRALGWRTVRITRSGGLYSRLQDFCAPDITLPDLTTFPDFLEIS